MAALFLLVGGFGMVAALLALHFRVCDLEATLRDRGICPCDGPQGGTPYDTPRGGTGADVVDALRAQFGDPPSNHRAGPAPRRVSNPDKPTSRPSGPLPDPPPTGRTP